ncbi:MAG: alpha/beta fold hydrolase [Fibrobacterota bacterium]
MKKIAYLVLSCTVLLLIGVLFLYFRGRFKPVLDQAVIEKLPGKTALLSRGRTYYNEYGAENSEVVLLVHGALFYSIIWKKNIDALVDGGYRVITFDQYGRGFSSRPDGPYTTEMFAEQIEELLVHLGIDAPLHIAGLSYGGPVSLEYANRNPDMIQTLTLLAPAGPQIGRRNVVTVISEFIERIRLQITNWKYERKRQKILQPLRKEMRRQFEYRGVEKAFASAFQNREEDGFYEIYNEASQHSFPVLLIWGTKDRVLLEKYSAAVREYLDTCTYVRLPAGHSVNYEKPERVNTEILRFISNNPVKG